MPYRPRLVRVATRLTIRAHFMILPPALPLLLLGVAAAVQPNPVPVGLDVSMKHATAHNAFMVELEPPASPAAINQIHSWHVRVTSPQGQPLHHARITVGGGMPQHGHGLPTHPKVTRELEDGAYLVEGMKFSMTGWWQIKLTIDAGGVDDTATFNTIVDSQASARRAP